MKKRINLFEQRVRNPSADAPFIKAKYATFGITAILSLILVIIFLYSQYLDTKMRNLKYQETIATHKIRQSSRDTLKLQQLVKNKNTMEKYLAEDAKFLPYYNLLNNLLLSMKGTPLLTELNLDNKRKTTFSLYFSKYQDLDDFLQQIETNEFSKHFDSLKMSEFTINENVADFKVDVEATFKPIYE